MDWGLATWLGLGFGLGLVHAFDADHVMAVSVFATRGDAAPKGEATASRNGFARGAKTGLRWAFGHGAVLLAVGVTLWAFGQRVGAPVSGGWAGWPEAAEQLVGAMMIALGSWVLFGIWRSHAHLHFHEHDDLPAHAHWHVHRPSAADSSVKAFVRKKRHKKKNEHRHEHAPVLVGGVHGLAGSAPLLAVIPAAAQSPYLGIAYLLFFAVGVAAAMAAVSGVLGHLTDRLVNSPSESPSQPPLAPPSTSRSRSRDRDAHAFASLPPAGAETAEPPWKRATALLSPLTLVRGLSASGSIAVGLWMVGAA